MILTRLRSRNHHHANPLKVTKMWIGKCKIVRTKNDGESDETMVHMMADNNHKRMVIPKVGLDDGMKKKVEQHCKNGFSATTAKMRKKIVNHLSNDCETWTSCKKEKSVRISARRDAKSRKGVQGGARGRK